MSTDLSKINISEKAIDLGKEVYEDALQPAVREIGKFAARVPRAINAALSSMDCWILHKEYNVEKTKRLLAKKLENTDPDKIVPPEPYVAVPAIQAISYSMDSDELRDLYANLLSKSIYADTKDSVHPAFVEIIKNLSPLDCRVFNFIMQKPTQEIGYYEIRRKSAGSTSYSVAFPYIIDFEFSTNDAVAASIDNLARNNLVSPLDFHYTNDDMYRPIRDTAFFKGLEKRFSTESENYLEPYKKAIKSTSFGKAFYKVCVTPL